MMVRVVEAGVPIVATPVGLASCSTMVSGPSNSVSLTVGTTIVFDACPAANDRVPLASVKATPPPEAVPPATW